MAITPFQRAICRLIAANRIEHGESYVAGGVALNLLTEARRISRGMRRSAAANGRPLHRPLGRLQGRPNYLFYDTESALDATWAADRALLEGTGFEVSVVRERAGFVEAIVSRDEDVVVMQWVRDSAYRFFPLVAHEELGLVLHPLDLATNKVLAMVGRLEVRDWVDLMSCHERVQPLGYLAWAACGKDPGFTPAAILEQAGRSGRYSAAEVAELSFDGPPPDAAALSARWRRMLAEAKEIVANLPGEHGGKCVLLAPVCAPRVTTSTPSRRGRGSSGQDRPDVRGRDAVPD
ncbi:MAG: hypothetical protein AB1505_02810 [Candidatus Latescibacterota bacterium]